MIIGLGVGGAAILAIILYSVISSL